MKITRRAFIKNGMVMAGGVLSGASLWPNHVLAAEEPDIVVVRGTEFYDNTVKAVDELGGMSRMVSRGDKVGLLVNHTFMNIGAHVHPDMTLAIARMCFDAGAKEITLIKSAPWRYFGRARSDKQSKDVIRQLKSPSDNYKTIPIKDAFALPKADIMKDLLDCDVFINTAIVKSHSATFITAVLKNMMGSTPFSTCRTFHKGGFINSDPVHLAKCIADINLVRKPDLCVMDATEILATGGPQGPGLVKKPLKIFAGRDPVAIDTYGASLLGVDPNKILMLDFAARHGLGRKELNRIRFREIAA
jgi:uncharacterized protein (DUF362 family)